MVKENPSNEWQIAAPVKTNLSKTEQGQKNQLLRIIDELNRRYGFRRNVVSHRPEFMSLADNSQWQGLNKQTISTITIWLKAKGYTVTESLLQTLLASDFVTPHNPIRYYFENLELWDGYDYISDLTDTIRTDNDSTFRRFFEKWIVGLVRGGYYPNVTNQQMLVFYGSQGIGKTRWFYKLLPKRLSDYFFTGYTDLEDRMFQMKLGTNFLIFMDELDTYRGHKQALIKSIITQESAKVRPMFKDLEQEVNRIASFAAAINHEGFLHDLSGSRRFLVFETLKINSEHDIDMDKVFAQAFHLAKDRSYLHYLNTEEQEELTRRNERFRVKTEVELLIEKYFQPCNPGDAACYVSNASEVISDLKRLTNNYSLKCSPNTVGAILTARGYEKGYIGTGDSKRNGYYVSERV
jgi:predicted P-loop ATPase